MKFFHPPIPITTTVNSDGEPVFFSSKRGTTRISRIRNRWRISKNWWRKEIAREYFQLETVKGAVCEIYRDMLTESWYLQRIGD